MMNYDNTTTYIGMTNDLERRILQHKSGDTKGFSSRYKLTKLVYFDVCDTAEQAIFREKQLKNWHRDWKLDLIRRQNPDFFDLSLEWQKIPNRVRNDGRGDEEAARK